MNPWRGLDQLPRENWILFTTAVINRSGTMALPFLVLYLTRSLGFTSDQAALILIGYGVGSLVTAPLAGRLCDLIGARIIMQLSFFLSGGLLIVFPMVSQFSAVMAITVLWAILSEAFRPANLAMITDLVAPEQRKAAFALNRLAINIGMSIGPAAGGFLVMISYPILFWVNGATAILAALVLTFVPWKPRYPHPAAYPSNGSEEKSSLLSDRRIIYFLAAMLPVLIVFFQHTSSMPLFLVNELHLPESDYGILFTLNTGLIIFLEVSLNLRMAHWPHRKALSLAALLVAVGFGSMMFSSDFFTVAITLAIWTFGEMILFPGASAYMAELAPPDRRGEYMGYYQMTFSLSFILGPWIGLQTYDHGGTNILWGGAFVLGGVSALMMSRISDNATKLVMEETTEEVVEHG
jgi:predicted MFS family arabinose efflux permease